MYGRLTSQRVSLGFDRGGLCYELFQAGFNKDDLQRVIRYRQREICEGRRSVGALRLSNFVQLDRFEEDLNISRVQLYAPKPASPAAPPLPNPKDDEAARQRASEILARFRVEHGWECPQSNPTLPPHSQRSSSPGPNPGQVGIHKGSGRVF